MSDERRDEWPPRRGQKPALHGSHSGYVLHTQRRAGEWSWPACGPCQKAHGEYNRRWQAVKRKALKRKAPQ